MFDTLAKPFGRTFKLVAGSKIEESSPDIVMYDKTESGHWDNPNVDPNHRMKSYVAYMRYARVGIMVEAKWNSNSAFSFKEHEFLLPNGAGARAQHFLHAAEVFRASHRHHLFSIYVVKRAARLVYFDRAGMVVSKPLDLTKEEGKRSLCKFVFSVAQMKRAPLGFDTSAELATDEDIKRIPPNPLNDYFSLCRNEMITEKDHFPIYKV